MSDNENKKNKLTEEEQEINDRRSGGKIIRSILTVIAILMIIGGSVYFGFYLYERYTAGTDNPYDSSTTVPTTTQEEKQVKNPIDFDTLKKGNSEIYAWIKIPGTKVDYPIVQSETDDNFYLKHSAFDKSYILSGAIFSQSANSTDFSDRVTVLYGHNSSNEKMIASLHRFEKADFFDKYDKIYVYTPSHKLTYKIVSEFKYDNRHILNSFDFRDDNIYKEFIDMVQNPESTAKDVRTNLGKDITTDDRLLVLSTCIEGQSSNRLLVCGVLTKDEKTY